MNKMQSFEAFLATATPHVNLGAFALNLLLSAVVLTLLAAVYRRYGNALSDRRRFAWNLVLVGLTTMVVITIVKSSLALSLGLVGALSIVRFRTPIKEPEELSYIFVAIAVGLGFGAGQRLVTVLGFAAIVAVVMARRGAAPSDSRHMHLTLSTAAPQAGLLERIVAALEPHARHLRLKRLDEGDGGFEADFVLGFEDFAALNAARSALEGLDAGLHLTFLDHRLD